MEFLGSLFVGKPLNSAAVAAVSWHSTLHDGS
jgi:hypothetical protein